MTEEMIPYIIIEAHPDNKKPHLSHDFGTIEKSKLDNLLLEKLVEFVLPRIDIENLESKIDVELFWLHFYDECYIDNSPWSAIIFMDGKWIYKSPSDEKLFNSLIKEKNRIYISSDSNETVESIIIYNYNDNSNINDNDNLDMENIDN